MAVGCSRRRLVVREVETASASGVKEKHYVRPYGRTPPTLYISVVRGIKDTCSASLVIVVGVWTGVALLMRSNQPEH